jgi:hypothetical protein
MRLRIRVLVLGALSSGLICAAGARAAALTGQGGPAYSWTGLAPLSDPGWSAGPNWVGGHAPSGSAAIVTFPVLTGCTASSKTCYTSENNLAGFRASRLVIDDGAGYYLGGNSLTLGISGDSGNGLVAGPSAASFNQGPRLTLPLALGTPQTWSITGGNLAAPVYLSGPVSGAGDALAITFASGGILSLADNVEVGPVTVSGNGTLVDGAGFSSDAGFLNSTDHKQVTISHSRLSTIEGSVGPLTATGSHIIVGGSEDLPTGSLGVSGSLNLTLNSALSMYINGSGTSAGNDYSSVNAEGNEALGGVMTLDGAAPNGDCPGLHKGAVDTLMSAMGTLTGRFTGLPNGTTVHLSCTGGVEPTLVLHYTAHTVTATVATAPPEAPVCDAFSFTTNKNTSVSVKFHCIENSSEKLAYKITAKPQHGTVGTINQTTGTVTYTPHTGYTGSDYFQYQATNTQGASNSAWAYLTVG